MITKVTTQEVVHISFFCDTLTVDRLVILVELTDGNKERFYFPVRDNQPVDFKVPKKAVAFVVFAQAGMDRRREKISSRIYIVIDNFGTPIKGARAFAASYTDNSDEMNRLIASELDDYPDHLFAYKSIIKDLFARDNIFELKKLLGKIQDVSGDYPEKYATLAYGYAFKGRIDKSIEYLKRYLNESTDFLFAPEVIMSMVENSPENIDKRVVNLLTWIAASFPKSSAGYYYISNMIWDDDSRKSDSVAEWIMEKRLESYDSTYFIQSLYFADMLSDLKSAAESAMKYIELVDFDHCDIDFSQWCERTSIMYRVLSRYYRSIGDYRRALEYAIEAYNVNDNRSTRDDLACFVAECAILAGDSAIVKEYILKAFSLGAVGNALNLLSGSPISPNETKIILNKLYYRSNELCESIPKVRFSIPEGKDIIPGESILVIYFWKPDSKSCIKLIPDLISFARKYTGEDISYLAVSDYPLDFFQNFPIFFKGWDICPNSRDIFEKFAITEIPYLMVIDKDERIRFSKSGPAINLKTAGIILDILTQKD